jgi:Aerotolerance regulator N-terminal/von Willebrand factor type A domain
MTFLNPAILWGLAAVTIPILIHILNLRRTKKIEFSTLMFLKEIEQSRYRKIKLKQLLILLLRIGFIIVLVLLFSRPFFKGYLGSPDDKPRSSVLIIIDDSFSMQSRESSGSSLEIAKKKAAETIDLLGEKDEVFFTTVSEINRLEKNMVYKDHNRLKDTLRHIKASDKTKELTEVIYFAGEILKTALNSAKEIYLFTDGQKSFIENAEALKPEFSNDEMTKTNIILTSSREADNISIDTVNTLTRIFEKNRPVKIKATLNNRNNYNVSNKSITLYYGTFKDEKVIDIPANSTLDVEFAFQPGKTGYSGGYIELTQSEIADDEISGDNRQYFGFFIPVKVNLLFAAPSAGDIEYLELALRTSEELMTDSAGNRSSYFSIKTTSPEQFRNENLDIFDAVVIVNKPGFSEQESQMLKNYIENGGGVIIYPGALSSADNYSNSLAIELNLPSIRQSFGDGTGDFRFDKIDYEHPVFEGIFRKQSERQNLGSESPVIKNGLDIPTGENAISLVRLNNEKNFLVEFTRGKGKLLMFSVSPDMKNSDYPATNLFSPISVRSILYLANVNSVKSAVTGKDYFADLENFSLPESDEQFFITNSEGLRDSVLVTAGFSVINLKSSINNASLYRLETPAGIFCEFPANVQKKESELLRFKGSEVAGHLRSSFDIDANIIEPEDILKSSISELRTGKEIWQYFLLLSLVFLIAEYLVAKSVTGKKKLTETPKA